MSDVSSYSAPGLSRRQRANLANKLKESQLIVSTLIVDHILASKGYTRTALSKSRKSALVYIRQVICFVLYHETTLSLREIGTLVGGRDHTTVIHSKDEIKKLTEEKEWGSQMVRDDVKAASELARIILKTKI